MRLHNSAIQRARPPAFQACKAGLTKPGAQPLSLPTKLASLVWISAAITRKIPGFVSWAETEVTHWRPFASASVPTPGMDSGTPLR
jgi:hypothetical protein